MILADTSVWVEHLRKGNNQLRFLLNDGAVFIHPFVIGELACGYLQNRKTTLHLLASLPQTEVAEYEEILHLVESKQLFGQGLGWVDMHLLASTLISKVQLWTFDRRLKNVAARLGVAL